MNDGHSLMDSGSQDPTRVCILKTDRFATKTVDTTHLLGSRTGLNIYFQLILNLAIHVLYERSGRK